jgi:hypothetical protein
MGARSRPHDSLDAFIAAAPLPQRVGMRALLALSRRPAGAALIRRAPAAAQLAQVLDGLLRYDDPRLAGELGWDADAVVARGRELRRREGRP